MTEKPMVACTGHMHPVQDPDASESQGLHEGTEIETTAQTAWQTALSPEEMISRIKTAPLMMEPEEEACDTLEAALAGLPDFAKQFAKGMAVLLASNTLEEEEDELPIFSLEDLAELLQSVYQYEEPAPQKASLNSPDFLRFAVLLSGPLSISGEYQPDSAALGDSSGETREELMQNLKEWWNVTDRESLLCTLRWLLKKGGHTNMYRKLCKMESPAELIDPPGDKETMRERMNAFAFTRQFRDIYSKHATAAWDLSRAVMMARWGRHLGYLSEEECTAILTKTALKASRIFSGWRAFAQSFLLGGLFWIYPQDPSDSTTLHLGGWMNAFEALFSPEKDAPGPWYETPWISEAGYHKSALPGKWKAEANALFSFMKKTKTKSGRVCWPLQAWFGVKADQTFRI